MTRFHVLAWTDRDGVSVLEQRTSAGRLTDARRAGRRIAERDRARVVIEGRGDRGILVWQEVVEPPLESRDVLALRGRFINDD
jgi:hypothetical protein